MHISEQRHEDAERSPLSPSRATVPRDIRYVGIEPPSSGGERSLARSFLLQLFHLRDFRSFVLSIEIPTTTTTAKNSTTTVHNNRKQKSQSSAREVRRMFQFMQAMAHLPTMQECANLQDEKLRIMIPLIRSMVLQCGQTDGHSSSPSAASSWNYKPADCIYSVNPLSCVFAMIKSNAEAAGRRTTGTYGKDEPIDEHIRTFHELIVIPSCRGFKCVYCGNVNTKICSNISIKIDRNATDVGRWMESLFRIQGIRTSSSPRVCSCSRIQPTRHEKVIYQAHRFPRILIIRLKQNQGIEFGKELDLTPHCVPGEERSMKYHLAGIVAELGSCSSPPSNHISYVREHCPEPNVLTQDNGCSWLKFGCSRGEAVARVAEAEVFSASRGGNGSACGERTRACMLLYVRQHLAGT